MSKSCLPILYCNSPRAASRYQTVRFCFMHFNWVLSLSYVSWFMLCLSFSFCLSSLAFSPALQCDPDKCTYLLCRYNTFRKSCSISPSLIPPDCYLLLSKHVPCHIWLFLSLLPLVLSLLCNCSRAGCCSVANCAFTFHLSWSRLKQINSSIPVSFSMPVYTRAY